ncbi:hypothetical protein DUI87_09938 [Hirundo rustica rustica]|uniref:Reverse transcriptase domain-containing protein n=1 Tax=Hirundo rustica rustica TaxID=333673 RepID=A0A3M0KGZ8_HIRRU|nr:hypothetical protein DUI87_09938 [Hirundo rustica rustica]
MYGNGFVGEEKGTERESVMMMSFRTPQCYWESEDVVEDEVIRRKTKVENLDKTNSMEKLPKVQGKSDPPGEAQIHLQGQGLFRGNIQTPAAAALTSRENAPLEDGGLCSTPKTDCPRGGNSPTICPTLIQAALGKGEAPEHLQYINDIIVSGNTATEVFEKGEKIIHILLEAGFAIKKSKVKGPAQEIQFLKVKWQDGRWQILTEVINKTTATSPQTSKKETQAFLGPIGFWRMHIPEYSQIVSPLDLVTHKKNDFHWGPEQ